MMRARLVLYGFYDSSRSPTRCLYINAYQFFFFPLFFFCGHPGPRDIQAFTIWMSNLLCAISAAFSLAHVGVASGGHDLWFFFFSFSREGGDGAALRVHRPWECGGVLYKIALVVGDFACTWRDFGLRLRLGKGVFFLEKKKILHGECNCPL